MNVQVLEFYGLEKQNKWAQLGYESLFFAGFTFLAWAVSALTSIAFLHFTFLLHAQDFSDLCISCFCCIAGDASDQSSICGATARDKVCLACLAGASVCKASEAMSALGHPPSHWVLNVYGMLQQLLLTMEGLHDDVDEPKALSWTPTC